MRIYIVEDNPLHATKLEDFIETLGHKVCGIAESFSEAYPKILAIKPDLLFLDIQLEGKESGIDLAEKVNENLNIPFVFLSSLTEQEVIKQASKAIPEAYLIKPASLESLSAVLSVVEAKISQYEKVKSNYLQTQNKEVLFVKVGNLFKKINLNDLVYVSYTQEKFSDLHLINNKVYPLKMGLLELESMLPNNFIRIHKSHIVNKHFIESVKSNFSALNLTDLTSLAIGRTYRNKIIDSL